MKNAAQERLDARLADLAGALQRRVDAIGLLALGSIGGDAARIDEWSDLDFFVVVQPEAKARYIAQLDWLAEAHALAWHFQNTADGHKALMCDGVYCEFAVFAPQELAHVPYSPGRWVWLREASQAALEELASPTVPMPEPRKLQWLVGEALSNLLVGLQRDRRGERLAAMRLIQVYALDRVLELKELLQGAAAEWNAQASRDAFAIDRRFERRWPGQAAWLQHAAGGYASNRTAAAAIFAELQTLAPVPDAMRQAITALTHAH